MNRTRQLRTAAVAHFPRSERTMFAEILDSIDEVRDLITTGGANEDELLDKVRAASLFSVDRSVIAAWPVWFTPDGMKQVRTTRRAIRAHIRKMREEQN